MTLSTTYTTALALALALLFTAGHQNSNAQSRHLTAQTAGLGGGGTAYQDLYHANFVNPANLMINHSSRPAVTLGIAGGIYSNVGGNLVNITTYNDYLTNGQVIDGAVADDMLDQWFGTDHSSMRDFKADVGVIPLGVSVRKKNWSVSAASRVRVLGSSGYSRGFADLVFKGLDSDQFRDARRVDMYQEVLAFNEVSVGLAMTILKSDSFFGFGENVRLHAGVAPKLLMGINYAQFSLDSSLQIQEATSQQNAELHHNFTYTLQAAGEISDQLKEYNTLRQNGADPDIGNFIEPTSEDFTTFKGSSLGVDLGLTLEMDIDKLSLFNLGLFRGEKKLRLGLSVTDIGTVTIDDRTRSFTASEDFRWGGIQYDPQRIDEEFNGDEGKYFESVLRDSVGNDIYGDFITRDETEINKRLPTMINAGTHLLLGKFSLMADVGAGFSTSRPETETVSISLGTEYRLLNRIPLRAGYKTGGLTPTTYHAGTGLEFRNFEFSVGVASSTDSRTNGAGVGAAWSGLVVHF